jgi:hypothetical protein
MTDHADTHRFPRGFIPAIFWLAVAWAALIPLSSCRDLPSATTGSPPPPTVRQPGPADRPMAELYDVVGAFIERAGQPPQSLEELTSDRQRPDPENWPPVLTPGQLIDPWGTLYMLEVDSGSDGSGPPTCRIRSAGRTVSPAPG